MSQATPFADSSWRSCAAAFFAGPLEAAAFAGSTMSVQRSDGAAKARCETLHAVAAPANFKKPLRSTFERASGFISHGPRCQVVFSASRPAEAWLTCHAGKLSRDNRKHESLHLIYGRDNVYANVQGARGVEGTVRCLAWLRPIWRLITVVLRVSRWACPLRNAAHPPAIRPSFAHMRALRREPRGIGLRPLVASRRLQ
jgi:hypothetical protein